MLPQSYNNFMEADSKLFEIGPSRTYKLDLVNKKVVGKTDDIDAILQFIKKVLSTDKYAHQIYDWYYGNELYRLSGKNYAYIITEIPRIVEEALTSDERIQSVSNFQFEKIDLESMKCSFTVQTYLDKIIYEMEVRI